MISIPVWLLVLLIILSVPAVIFLLVVALFMATNLLGLLYALMCILVDKIRGI